jgi:hypothetical protein
MRTAGILAAVVLSFASLHARAEPSKAWTAAKAGLPADAKIVIGADLVAIQKTQLFATYYPKLLEKGDAGKVIEKVKGSCKIDPLTAVQGVVVATSADQEDGAVYLSITGLDKAKLSSCLTAAVQGMADKDAKVTLKQDGNITQVSDGKDTAFIGWIGKDVIVVSLHAKDKSSLLKWMGGKGALAKSDVGKSIAKLNTAATMWGAGEASKEIEPGVTVKGGYGTVTFAKGNLDADVHAVMANAPQATKMATSTKKQLDEAKQGQLPKTFVTMLSAVSIAAANDEVVLKGSFVEQDLLSVLALAAGGFGGP